MGYEHLGQEMSIFDNQLTIFGREDALVLNLFLYPSHDHVDVGGGCRSHLLVPIAYPVKYPEKRLLSTVKIMNCYKK